LGVLRDQLVAVTLRASVSRYPAQIMIVVAVIALVLVLLIGAMVRLTRVTTRNGERLTGEPAGCASRH
jgi:hypothetical protein